jgi:hypothetical protein
MYRIFFAKAPRNSALHETILATSLANFDRRTGFVVKGIRLDMERHYGNALRLVAQETQDATLAASDELALAVQMLGIFEVRNVKLLRIWIFGIWHVNAHESSLICLVFS